ncbi:probable G-protein coupled receptor 101 [Protopterus annectens]|uniref:probable G-protein coupled receptor 101 n=1 Tax=Protopterus annectens TaxID=7888 RepID=UPI001CFB2A71|nr:probable G-protein coupled receptor 101 [Protopterus annectens]
MSSFHSHSEFSNSTHILKDINNASTAANCFVRISVISVIVCTSLFGNVLVLMVFQRKPQLLHIANRFVFNLLIADLFQTVLVMPVVILATMPYVWPLDQRLCKGLVVLMHLFAFAGVNTIIVVSIDRYLAIIHPLSYPTRMTPQRCSNLIVLTWLLGIIQSTPPLYGWGKIDFDQGHNVCTVLWSFSYSYTLLVALFSFWLPVCIMLGCYWMVFRAARRQNALVHPIQTANGQAKCDELSKNSGSRVRPRHLHYHCKAAKVVFVIMFSYIIGMGPYSLLSMVLLRRKTPVPQWITTFALILFFLQCCIHPYIYGYMHRSVRKEFVLLLCGCFCRQTKPRVSTIDSYCTATEGTVFHTQFSAVRVRPMHSWEVSTSSARPDKIISISKDSTGKETTSTSFSSEKELYLLPSKIPIRDG